MLSIVEVTFRYLADRPQVHSEVSGLPFMVSYNFGDYCSYRKLVSFHWGVFLSCVFVYCSALCIKICLIGTSSVVWGSPTQSLSLDRGGSTLIALPSTCRWEWSLCPFWANPDLLEISLAVLKRSHQFVQRRVLWTLKITFYQSRF